MRKALVGPAGEHYVLFRLYQQGVLAALAPPGTPTVDTLVLDANGDDIVATLQVKTRTIGSDGGWYMNKKHESVIADRLLYAFVDLQGPQESTYIVPSTIVADVLTKSHKAWLATPGKGGKKHNDHPMRRIIPNYPWHVPGLPAEWMTEWNERWDLITGDL